jgi:hypothetical protein
MHERRPIQLVRIGHIDRLFERRSPPPKSPPKKAWTRRGARPEKCLDSQERQRRVGPTQARPCLTPTASAFRMGGTRRQGPPNYPLQQAQPTDSLLGMGSCLARAGLLSGVVRR